MIESILVGTDGSERAERAVATAVDIAKGQGARLLIVAAFRDEDAHWEGIQSSRAVSRGNLRDAAENVLIRSARHAEDHGIKGVEWEAHSGHPADVLLDVAKDRDVDLIVVGNKGMGGTRRFFLGGVADKVSHHAPCSVMIVQTD
ncbi:MAG: universal stress protein [Thermoleophilaceae bacterium]|nr:universal stress protein [Thermoleophilaceae bacterium]